MVYGLNADQPHKLYNQATAKAMKMWPPFLDVILKVGLTFSSYKNSKK